MAYGRPNVLLSFSLFRVAMDFIEDIRVGQECAQAGLRAEIDRPAAILDAREIGGIRVAEFSPAQADKLLIFLLLRRLLRHWKIELEY